MEDTLIEILERFEVPVYRQGSLSNDEAYPETLITFWNNDSPDHAHYDNAAYGTAWNYTVNVYSSRATVTYSLLASIRAALKEAGWVVKSKGFDVPSDEETLTGRGIECEFLEV